MSPNTHDVLEHSHTHDTLQHTYTHDTLQSIMMNNDQFQVFLQFLGSLTKTLREQGQEIMQFTAAVKKGSKTEGTDSSMHNPANKPKISIKLPTYSGKMEENIFMWCKQLQTIFKAQGIDDDAMKIYYASTVLVSRALHWYLNQQGENDMLPWNNWKSFEEALRDAFQPPHYQQHL